MATRSSSKKRASSKVPSPVVHGGIKYEASITIQRSPDELYNFWRDFHNLPKFIWHLDRVGAIDEKRAHWAWKTVGGIEIEWDSEIIAEIPGKMISWQTLPGADVPNAGSIWFMPAPAGRGTEIRLLMAYDPPAGKLGDYLSRLFGENPKQTMREDLRRLRALMEAGEIPTIQGQTAGAGRARRSASQGPQPETTPAFQ
jgi:uncharacterized membrane protein